MSLLTAADSSDDSSPSNADQGDRQLLNVSSEIAYGTQHAVHSDGDGDCVQCGPQTENMLRRASLPPLSASSVSRVADRRGSSPVIGSHHVSCRKVCFLTSLAEYPSPLVASPSATRHERLTTSSSGDLDVSRFCNNDKPSSVCENSHEDVVLADSNVILSGSESKECSLRADGTEHLSANDLIPDEHIYDIGSNGASFNGVSLTLPKPNCAGVRRASAPIVCYSPLPPARATRRGSAPSPGAELVAVSLWTSKTFFDAKSFSAVHCRTPSVVLIESPRLNVGVDQLEFVCVVTNNSSLSVLEPDAERCRKKRSHSAHAVIINPARFVERRYSTSSVTLNHCLNASNLIHQSPSSNSYTPLSISGIFQR